MQCYKWIYAAQHVRYEKCIFFLRFTKDYIFTVLLNYWFFLWLDDGKVSDILVHRYDQRFSVSLWEYFIYFIN